MNSQEVEVIEVRDYGSVGAGTVVPFVPSTKTSLVIIPRGLAKPEQAGTLTISGMSLIGDGITDGDILCFRTNHSDIEITKDSICVVRIRSTGEMLAKHVIPDGDKIVLRSSNPDYIDRSFEYLGVEVMGLAFGIQRMADRCGRFSSSSATFQIGNEYT